MNDKVDKVLRDAWLKALYYIEDAFEMSRGRANEILHDYVTKQATPSLRDQFAMAALAGVHPVNAKDAEHAYAIADAMLEARKA